MNHEDHVNLLRNGILQEDGTPFGTTWADFGSGTGAFTLALADLLGSGGKIYSIDRDGRALRQQSEAMKTRFPSTRMEYRTGDFARPLDPPLPPLDGLTIANALHFIVREQQVEVVKRLKSYLKPGGRMVIVEYDVDQGNWAVPYPMTFKTWTGIAERGGFSQTRLLMTRPSRFLNGFFSALSY